MYVHVRMYVRMCVRVYVCVCVCMCVYVCVCREVLGKINPIYNVLLLLLPDVLSRPVRATFLFLHRL